MESNSYKLAAAGGTDDRACTFLDVLPLEIREIIYQNVLMVKCEHNMNSHEYDMHRSTIMLSADHTYRFYTAILRTNHQIHREANAVFKRDCLLVRLIAPQYSAYQMIFEECGLSLIAKGERARNIPHVNMTLEFESVDGSNDWWPFGQSDTECKPADFVFAGEDLPAFCMVVLRTREFYAPSLKYKPLHITIDHNFGDSLVEGRDRCPSPGSKISRLLDPLRQLRRMGTVRIDGLRNAPFIGKLINSMCSLPDRATDTIENVLGALEQGDKARDAGDIPLAAVKYKYGLDTLYSIHHEPGENDQILRCGLMAGQTIKRAQWDLEIRLQTRLADSYLKMRKLRMARIYAERVYGPVHSGDNRGNHLKTPLQVSHNEEAAYADIMVVAAQISFLHGQAGEAHEELQEAIRLRGGLDSETERLLGQYEESLRIQEQRRVLREKRLEWHLQERYKKAENAVRIVLDRKCKGDESFRSGKFMKAISKYKAGIDKLDSLKNTDVNTLFPYTGFDLLSGVKSFQHERRDFPQCSPIVGFLLNLQSSLTRTNIKFGAYETALYWADTALNNRPTHHSEGDQEEWAGFSQRHYQTAYLCKVVAFEKLGRFGEVNRNMAKAQEGDPGDGTVFERFAAMKTAWEEYLLGSDA